MTASISFPLCVPQGPGPREEGGERGDRCPVGNNNDEGWRPPPPGLGRGNNRNGGGGGGAPPGLTSTGEQWERPWGAGEFSSPPPDPVFLYLALMWDCANFLDRFQ